MEAVLIAIAVLFGLALFAFWLWMLVDCLANESPEGNERLTWALVIGLTKGIGAIVYYFVRRPKRRALASAGGV